MLIVPARAGLTLWCQIQFLEHFGQQINSLILRYCVKVQHVVLLLLGLYDGGMSLLEFGHGNVALGIHRWLMIDETVLYCEIAHVRFVGVVLQGWALWVA